MKILYGVQGTGNGHITRARALNKYFSLYGIEADFLFSGRERGKYFDMEEFRDWRSHRGLTFIHEAGSLRVLRTLQQNSLRQLITDIRGLDLSAYACVLTDFEPITAWACRLANKPCIGVGHQYAFDYPVPRRADTFVSRMIMRNFAPVKINLGLHWHHFGYPILPPIAETGEENMPIDPHKIVVYLGFEEPEDVIRLLKPFENYLFVFYGPFPQYESRGHIQLKPLSRDGFKHDLATAAGVICNAGFELSSEAIQLGRKLLVKPLQGQVEQLSNALALEKLELAMTMETLNRDVVKEWLASWPAKRVVYPNVARAIVEWLSKGRWQNPSTKIELVESLWQQVQASELPHFAPFPPAKIA